MKTIILIICILLIFSYSYALELKALKFVYQDSENYPFETETGPNVPAKKPGISVEMMKVISKRIGIPFTFSRRPWKRCLVELESNAFDGLFQASYKADRLKYGVYPYKDGVVNPEKRSHSNSYYLFVMRNSKVHWDGKNLKRVDGIIGAPLGYSIVSDLKLMGLNVHEEKSTFQNFRMLKEGYLSVVVDFGRSGKFYMRKYPYIFSEILMIEPPISIKHYYVMLSHKLVQNNPSIAFKIWDEIEKFRNSELYSTISANY